MLDRREDHRPESRRAGWLPVAAVVVMISGGASAVVRAVTVDGLSWEHDAAGRTVVTVSCSSPVDPATIRSYPLADPPRAVVVLAGARSRLDRLELEIGDRFVQRVRLVAAGTTAAPELLVVLDLADTTARIVDLRPDEQRLRAIVADDGPAPTVPSVAPTPTAAPLPTAVTPVPTPVPTSVPTAFPTPIATPVPTEIPNPAATPDPTPVPAPVATAMPIAPRLAIPTRRPALSPSAPAAPPSISTSVEPADPPPTVPAPVLPTVATEDGPARRIVELTAAPRGDGATVLLITADGRLPQGCARTLEMAGDPPRVVVSIRGLSAPDLPRTIELDDPVVATVRIVHDGEAEEGELHLVVQLGRPDAAVAAVNQVGRRLAILLAPRAAADDAP
jgi:hypothetical protein